MTTETTVKKFELPMVEKVLTKVNSLKEIGGIALPPDYSAENALRSAWLILQDMKDKTNLAVLKTSTPDSIANALFNMVVQGLNPAKHQCSFIVYGDKLTMQREYAGSIALARRYSAMKNIYAGVIYKGDVFEYAIDTTTGMKKITVHAQRMENLDDAKIIGAYAVVTFDDGGVNTEIMTMAQIQKSWEQGSTKGQSPAHKNFPGEMAKKTVINRACKLLIAASDDSVLMEPGEEGRIGRAKAEIDAVANQGSVIDIPDDEPFQVAEEVKEVCIPIPDKPENKREWKNEASPKEPGF
ncbi:MAG: recombinase RecT [Bacteroidales bacterium]